MKKDITSQFPDLKPCPFCGSPAVATKWGIKTYSIGCSSCMAEMLGRKVPIEETVKAWNSRTVNDSN